MQKYGWIIGLIMLLSPMVACLQGMQVSAQNCISIFNAEQILNVSIDSSHCSQGSFTPGQTGVTVTNNRTKPIEVWQLGGMHYKIFPTGAAGFALGREVYWKEVNE